MAVGQYGVRGAAGERCRRSAAGARLFVILPLPFAPPVLVERALPLAVEQHTLQLELVDLVLERLSLLSLLRVVF